MCKLNSEVYGGTRVFLYLSHVQCMTEFPVTVSWVDPHLLSPLKWCHVVVVLRSSLPQFTELKGHLRTGGH